MNKAQKALDKVIVTLRKAKVHDPHLGCGAYHPCPDCKEIAKYGHKRKCPWGKLNAVLKKLDPPKPKPKQKPGCVMMVFDPSLTVGTPYPIRG